MFKIMKLKLNVVTNTYYICGKCGEEVHATDEWHSC